MTQDQYIDFCLWHLEHEINATMVSREEIAAVLLEPGLAEGGNWIPTRKFVRGVREICDRNQWLLISDEVLTGLGRTGKMWGIEHYDVTPDILVYGKNLSGGIAPLAGISARDDILGDVDFTLARPSPVHLQAVRQPSKPWKSMSAIILSITPPSWEK